MVQDKWTEDENIISNILAEIKQGHFIIVENPVSKNISFKEEWKCDFNKVKILVGFLELDDYQYSVPNKDSRLKTQTLHIFKHTYFLVDAFARAQDVCVYIKMGIVGDKHVLLVSFHEDEPM